MEEIWRDIKGYENKYQVSNLGNVRSLHFNNTNEIRQISKHITNNGGYEYVILSKHNKCSYPLIHKLVAQAFIPNPLSKEQVTHIDGNKLNNKVDNLKWVYISESKHKMFNEGKRKESKGTGTKISYNDKNYNTYTAIARDFGIPLNTFYNRLYNLNWSLYEALEIPISIKKGRRK